jgi:hypothetical protein
MPKADYTTFVFNLVTFALCSAVFVMNEAWLLLLVTIPMTLLCLLVVLVCAPKNATNSNEKERKS